MTKMLVPLLEKNRYDACIDFLQQLNIFTPSMVKQIFTKANETDIPILVKKINDKVMEVKFKFESSPLSFAPEYCQMKL